MKISSGTLSGCLKKQWPPLALNDYVAFPIFFLFCCTRLTSEDGIPKIQDRWELQLPIDHSLIPLVETGNC